MNNEIELKIIELIDDGATLENSSELKNIIKSSQEAEILYKNILASDKLLKNFFGEDDRKELDNMTEIFVSKKVKKPYKINSLGSKSTIAFAIAAIEVESNPPLKKTPTGTSATNLCFIEFCKSKKILSFHSSSLIE